MITDSRRMNSSASSTLARSSTPRSRRDSRPLRRRFPRWRVSLSACARSRAAKLVDNPFHGFPIGAEVERPVEPDRRWLGFASPRSPHRMPTGRRASASNIRGSGKVVGVVLRDRHDRVESVHLPQLDSSAVDDATRRSVKRRRGLRSARASPSQIRNSTFSERRTTRARLFARTVAAYGKRNGLSICTTSGPNPSTLPQPPRGMRERNLATT